MNDMPGRAATADGRDGSGFAFAPRIQQRSTGSDCKSLYCLPKYCLCDSSLRTSDTGSPNTHCLGRPLAPRTMQPRKPEPAVNRQSRQQEQRWQPESRESSSTSTLDAITTPSRLSVFAAGIVSQLDGGPMSARLEASFRCGRCIKINLRVTVESKSTY